MSPGIAVFGGTFDPVHEGHLSTADALLGVLPIEEVRMVPSFVPPHRAMPASSALHRKTMLELALDGRSRLRIDTRELTREGKSFTYDTLASIRNEVGAATPVFFVMGMDAFITLPEWHRWEEIAALAHIVVVARPGYEKDIPASFGEWLRDKVVDSVESLVGMASGKVIFLSLRDIDLSSTKIREQLIRNKDPKGLSPNVKAYIKQERLYAE